MDGNTASIDSCDSRRRNYNVFFLGFFYKIVEKCSLSGSGFPCEKNASVGVFYDFKKRVIHRFKDRESGEKNQVRRIKKKDLIKRLPFVKLRINCASA